ncbi:IS1/IS1595 family N-terminal zinc-binding domain-containing protein [Spirosoma luteum]|uniref:IS1/IS1595 family N-terminal zinc-binding domain-containing protein n=1 Tax=Spirosoma luteum TaxID=431553 RepID=UPI003CCC00B7
MVCPPGHQHNSPNCGSTNVVKNGSTYYGKARLKCKTASGSSSPLGNKRHFLTNVSDGLN